MSFWVRGRLWREMAGRMGPPFGRSRPLHPKPFLCFLESTTTCMGINEKDTPVCTIVAKPNGRRQLSERLDFTVFGKTMLVASGKKKRREQKQTVCPLWNSPQKIHAVSCTPPSLQHVGQSTRSEVSQREANGRDPCERPSTGWVQGLDRIHGHGGPAP